MACKQDAVRISILILFAHLQGWCTTILCLSEVPEPARLECLAHSDRHDAGSSVIVSESKRFEQR